MPVNKAEKLKPVSDAVEILHRQFYEGKPAHLKNLDDARANEEIARKIQELRAAARSVLRDTEQVAVAVLEPHNFRCPVWHAPDADFILFKKCIPLELHARSCQI